MITYSNIVDYLRLIENLFRNIYIFQLSREIIKKLN